MVFLPVSGRDDLAPKFAMRIFYLTQIVFGFSTNLEGASFGFLVTGYFYPKGMMPHLQLLIGARLCGGQKAGEFVYLIFSSYRIFIRL
jgi:hypothetical protein